MNHIDNLPEATTANAGVAVRAGKEMDRDELRFHVARGYRLRGEAIRSWTKAFVRTLASLWRRPGRAIPEGYQPSGQVPRPAGH